MRKSFQTKVKLGDTITIYGNAFFAMLGMSYATGKVIQVRGFDGFVLQCNETKANEVIEDGDGEIELLGLNNYYQSR